jgi:tRNA(fMet)-specific endonuclease VapC
MGLILDSSFLIAGERRGESVLSLLERVKAAHGETETALSVVTVAELTHGIYRAKADADRRRRQSFVTDCCAAIPVHPVTLEIAQLAGRIDAEQMSLGIRVAFADLLIGVTALHLGYGIVTDNVRHFQMIPGLKIVKV